MGCIGKITSYIETPDYRLVLNLEGVCRFVLHDRNLTPQGYFQASIDCQDYLSDLNNMEPNVDRTELIQKYTNFFKMKKLDIDKDVLAETSNLQLLSTLAMLAPFNKIDKQAYTDTYVTYTKDYISIAEKLEMYDKMIASKELTSPYTAMDRRRLTIVTIEAESDDPLLGGHIMHFSENGMVQPRGDISLPQEYQKIFEQMKVLQNLNRFLLQILDQFYPF